MPTMPRAGVTAALRISRWFNMRKNSPKQTKASRKNGSKGNGPTSPEGKQKVKLNAMKDALFTKEIVVEGAGERAEDFERLKQEMWDLLQPATTLEEMFVVDFIENRWRMQRVRRAESLELKNRIRLADWTNSRAGQVLGSRKLSLLKANFFACFEKYLILSRTRDSLDALKTQEELEEFRSKLASTSEGVQFLIDQLTSVEKEAQSVGYFGVPSANLVLACCGFRDEFALRCVGASLKRIVELKRAEPKKEQDTTKANSVDVKLPNSASEAQATESEEPEKEGQAGEPKESDNLPDLDDFRQVLVEAIKILIDRYRTRKLILDEVKEVKKEVRAALALLPEGADRFSRAETTFERRMYRALAMLFTIREADDRRASLLLPPK
jgi:hypothetical protein